MTIWDPCNKAQCIKRGPSWGSGKALRGPQTACTGWDQNEDASIRTIDFPSRTICTSPVRIRRSWMLSWCVLVYRMPLPVIVSERKSSEDAAVIFSSITDRFRQTIFPSPFIGRMDRSYKQEACAISVSASWTAPSSPRSSDSFPRKHILADSRRITLCSGLRWHRIGWSALYVACTWARMISPREPNFAVAEANIERLKSSILILCLWWLRLLPSPHTHRVITAYWHYVVYSGLRLRQGDELYVRSLGIDYGHHCWNSFVRSRHD